MVLDASARLALIEQESGWEVVATAAAAEDATIGSVNYSETLQKAARLGVRPELVDSHVDALGITVSQFRRLDARLAASSYRHGPDLSLGDRACSALARNLSSPAYPADRKWLN